ncbi:cobW protein [Thiobacillus denitrificans ATCC 25259]|uniref:CobW protein n=1 Tax=Thiobacillus denitrificans (strain ATCC 25259 / T1) TaxID=292415 RepID=Q3SFW9_THIDA|nr:GTP-binding protein [Thiobacillus denitrificans]AAZ98487.1 cobW protein [Thiobacillus denitrificans ATCC 25259]
MIPPEPIPVTLLTGFLGSGKTTVLNQIVRQLPRTAILMNEFGEVALDHQLLQEMEGPLALLSGGCVCCTISGSLSPTLKNLWMARDRGDIPAFERVVIETTGIADPVPVLDNLLHDNWVRARFRLDGVVATVDALVGMGQLDEHAEAVKQVAVADRLLLTKTDLAPAATTAALRERLAALNPAADILTVTHGALDPAAIQNLGLWNAATRTLEVARWLKPERYRQAVAGRLGGKPRTALHDSRIEAFSVLIDTPLDRYGLQSALSMLTAFRAENLLRFKAIVNLKGEALPVVLHGVQHVLYPEVQLDAWPDDDRRSRFVFIVRDLEPQFVAKLLADFSGAARIPDPATP